MSKITTEDVKQLAVLAKLALTKEETANIQRSLEDLLGYVAQLSEIDTENVEPTVQVNNLNNVMRSDDVFDYGVARNELLKIAPDTIADYIKVPRVLE